MDTLIVNLEKRGIALENEIADLRTKGGTMLVVVMYNVDPRNHSIAKIIALQDRSLAVILEDWGKKNKGTWAHEVQEVQL